ncbi:hypothetical protein [Devosia sp. RR2S18]|uniref:hypothetical protein n=1 Tax=Devosia rhizosphaerae TaxID=3049774 RepID=UPI002541810C|nr:hypothetical protein [Devosia sp. RR2S18]WIJ24552.1 hypothetical protein QOV41_16255 [Devosia sp. RR2S18]
MRYLTGLALLPLFFVPVPTVLAQPNGVACATIEADAQRLACYDEIFRPGGEIPISDGVVLPSEQLIPARPSGRAPATLTVACEAGTLNVEFAFAGNELSASGRDAGISLQYDLQRSRSRTLPVNDTNTALVINGTPETLEFLSGLVGTTNLTARVTPINSRSLTVRFRLNDFLDRVAPVRTACGA